MPRLDPHTLTQQVRAILANPETALPPTGDTTLDGALAALARQRRAGVPLSSPHLGFWEIVSIPPASRRS